MSNRKSASQLRREWWLLCIRERPKGRLINCRGGMAMDDDLRRLIDDGVVGIRRLVAHGRRKFTVAFLKDDSTNPVGPVVCPCCKRMHYQTKGLIHKMSCVVPNGYNSGAYQGIIQERRKKGMGLLSYVSWTGVNEQSERYIVPGRVIY
jgi:hypothetical protein